MLRFVRGVGGSKSFQAHTFLWEENMLGLNGWVGVVEGGMGSFETVGR